MGSPLVGGTMRFEPLGSEVTFRNWSLGRNTETRERKKTKRTRAIVQSLVLVFFETQSSTPLP